MNQLFQKIGIGVLSVILVVIVAAKPAMAGINPDFDLMSLEGNEITLESQVDSSKWLLVMFWATDCPICVTEKPLISKFHSEHKSVDAQVVGIALDGYANAGVIKDYLALHKPSFPSYTGDYNDLASRYATATGEVLRGTPTYLLYTPEGELVGNNPGPVSPQAIERFIKKYHRSHR